MQNPSHFYDVLVIGTGAAGLGLALSLANHLRVALISKGALEQGASQYAQGGIAAVLNTKEDSYENHIEDTMNAGAGLCHRDAVEFVVRNGKKAIEWLSAQGVQFTRQDNQFHLTQEGGHGKRRILHVADKTGSAVISTLSEQVLQHPNIDCFTECTAVDLITQQKHCLGATVLNNHTGEIEIFLAKNTVLATGGASSCYLHTTNPDTTSGDGIAMAWRAGCNIANLEFNQFHPTALYHPSSKSFLISEAMRGEGAVLKLPNGERFMQHYDPRTELAPRDIVARAIDCELKKNKITHVLLDISHVPAERVKKFFPTIYERCLSLGIDITKEPIPVVPAAHYTCGGVLTNLNGATNVKNLYAIGEVACTGLHGANRMASNSLLECVVFAMSAAQQIMSDTTHHAVAGLGTPSVMSDTTHHAVAGLGTPSVSERAIEHTIRTIVWEKAGIVRSTAELLEAQKELKMLKEKAEDIFQHSAIDRSTIELRNLATVALLIVECALQRKESRGLHYNVDFPFSKLRGADTLLKKYPERQRRAVSEAN